MAKKCQIIKGREVCPKPNLFSQGYLGRGPFQEGEIPPSDLSGLTWWLDDPAQSFNSINNVIEAVNVSAHLSRDVAYALSNDYTSDFSAGTDGNAAIRGTLAGNIDGVSDGTESKDDVLRFFANTVNSTHQIRLTAASLTVGRIYSLKSDIFVPSAQTACDGFSIGDDSGNQYQRFAGINGSWTSIEVVFVARTAVTTIHGLSGASTVFIGADNVGDDLIYIKNVVIDEITGNHHIQLTAADQGLRSASVITYDGGNEFAQSNLNIANFSQSEGEFFIVAEDLEGVGAQNVFIAFGDASTDNEHLAFGINAANKVFIEYRTGGVTNTVTFATVTRGTTALYSFSSSGTAYRCEVGGINKPTDGGADNGNWVADNALLDTFAIASIQKLSNLFFNVGFVSGVGSSVQLTAGERLGVTTYLNNRFGL